jgi:methyl-accepting chemotaxis protein
MAAIRNSLFNRLTGRSQAGFAPEAPSALEMPAPVAPPPAPVVDVSRYEAEIDAERRKVANLEARIERMSAEQAALTQQLHSAIDEIQSVVKKSVGGDLVTRVNANGMSEDFVTLCADVNAVLNARRVIIKKVQVLTADVHSAADEISKGNTRRPVSKRRPRRWNK